MNQDKPPVGLIFPQDWIPPVNKTLIHTLPASIRPNKASPSLRKSYFYRGYWLERAFFMIWFIFKRKTNTLSKISRFKPLEGNDMFFL